MTHVRTTTIRRPSSLGLAALAALAALLTLLGATRPAAAQGRRGPLLILGLRAPDGDDEAATNATNALRRAARNAGFEVPNTAPALEQSMAAFGCDDSLPADCLAQIAADLHAERMVYGSVRRQGRGRDAQLRIDVSLYDHSTHTTAAHDQITVGRAVANDADALSASTRRMIDNLLPPPATPPPGGGGNDITPPPVTPPVTPPARPVPVRRYVGLAVMGVGVAAAVVGTVFGIQWLGLRGELDPERADAPVSDMTSRWYIWNNYFGNVPMGDQARNGDAICRAARSDAMARLEIQSICDQSSSLLTGWLVGSIAGGVLFTTGLVLALTDTTGSAPAATASSPSARRRARPALPPFALVPNVSPMYQGATLRVQF